MIKQKSAPEWQIWRYLNSVTLADAILLSQNLDPHIYTLDASEKTLKISKVINRILLISINCIETENIDWLISRGPRVIDAYRVQLKLTDYFSWLIRKGLLKNTAVIKNFKELNILQIKNLKLPLQSTATKNSEHKNTITKNPTALNWSIKKTKRDKVEYSHHLTKTLKDLHESGCENPTAEIVAKHWSNTKPRGIAVDLIKKTFTYPLQQSTKTSTFKNLSDSIGRRIIKK